MSKKYNTHSRIFSIDKAQNGQFSGHIQTDTTKHITLLRIRAQVKTNSCTVFMMSASETQFMKLKITNKFVFYEKSALEYMIETMMCLRT